MHTVTFSFDLGDCLAIYTGRVVGQIDDTFLVTYYEPTVKNLLNTEIRRDQIMSRGWSPVRMLPLAPAIQEPTQVLPLPLVAQPQNVAVYA